MTTGPFDFAHWLQDLSARSLADQQRAAERYTDLMQRVARGELSEQQVRAEFLRFAGEAGARYASDLAQLSLSYYNALLDLGRTYNERFYDHVLHGSPHPAQPANGQTSSTPRQVQLDLHGVLGSDAVAGFVIENKHSTSADVSFLFSDFVDAAGGVPFRPLLQLQPAALTLAPEQEAEVRLRLPLVPELFDAGHQYRTKVVVHGYGDLELLITVTVDPAPEPATRVAKVVTQPVAPPPAETTMPEQPASSKRSPGRGTSRRTKKASGPQAHRRTVKHTD